MTMPAYEHFARTMHGDQTYAGKPYYDAHLQPVIGVLGEFGFDGWTWQARGALHDVAEDCLLDLEPSERRYLLRHQFGVEVSDPVWAVSGFGLNRKMRNLCIYEKLQWCPEAKPLKCADRIVNVEQTIADESAHASMYLRERDDFELAVRSGVPASMWNRLLAGYERLIPISAARILR